MRAIDIICPLLRDGKESKDIKNKCQMYKKPTRLTCTLKKVTQSYYRE